MAQAIDLFTAASTEGAWTVGEVTRRARAVIEAGLPPLWIRGEIAGFKAWRSGHWYFSLRDKSAQIRCVMFAKQNYMLPVPVDLRGLPAGSLLLKGNDLCLEAADHALNAVCERLS